MLYCLRLSLNTKPFDCLQLEELFSSSFSLQAEDMAGHFRKAPAAALQGPDEATALPSSSQAPFDWSLKTRVRFSSSEPFALAEEASCSSARTTCSSIRSFASCSADGLKPLQASHLQAQTCCAALSGLFLCLVGKAIETTTNCGGLCTWLRKWISGHCRQVLCTSGLAMWF